MSSTTSPEFDDERESISSAGESTLGDLRECIELLDRVWPGANPACPDALVRVPEQLGRFRIVRELGRGGFGVVFLAEDPELGRKLALKVPRVEVLSHGEGWRGFLREARAAARLDHPNLVPLLETGTIGAVGYIASVYVDGPSLEGWLATRHGPVPPRQAARLAAVLAEAIEHAHQRGILHRDLKPANVLLQPLPTEGTSVPAASLPFVPRVCDFGLAKLLEAEAEESRSMVAAGSPSYMAPEQAEGKRALIGPATDVYGLGAILYQMLTGRAPFGGASSLEILRRVVSDEPVPPRRLNPDVPRDLEAICLRCLSKRPERRYSTASALAADLQRFLEGHPTLARPARPWQRAWKWSQRHPAPAALVVLAAFTTALAAAGLVLLGRINAQLNRALDEEQGLVAAYRVRQAQQALAAGDFKQAGMLLALAAPAGGAGGAGDFSWKYLDRESRRRLDLRCVDGAVVNALCPSPDGRTLASGDEQGVVRLWDLASGTLRVLEPAHAGAVHQIRFSPDGRTLASIASIRPGELFLWDVATARFLGTVGHRGPDLLGVWFTPDGTSVLALNLVPRNHPHRLLLWDVANPGTEPRTPDPPLLQRVGMSDCRLQAIADLLDGREAVEIASPAGDRRPPRGVAFTRDGALAVAGPGDGSFEVLWTSGRELIGSGRFDTPSGTQLFYSRHAIAYFKLADVAARLEALARRPGHQSKLRVQGYFEALSLLPPSGREVAIISHGDQGISLVDRETWRQRATAEPDPLAVVRRMALFPDGHSLAFALEDRRIGVWRFDSQDWSDEVRGHAPKEGWDVAFRPDGGLLATSGDDHRIRTWDPTTGREGLVLRGHDSMVAAIAWSPGGRMLASGSLDSKVRTWDPLTGQTRAILVGHTGFVRAVAFSPDGAIIASGGDDHTVRLWDAATGKPLASLADHTGRIYGVAFSPDGRTLATGGLDGKILLWDRSTLRSKLFARGAQVGKLAYARDGRSLASVHVMGPPRIWDPGTGKLRIELLGHLGDANHVAFSPDGRTIATAGMDQTVRIWDAASGLEMLCLTGHRARVNSVAFSPDGRTLASVDHTGALRFWRAEPRRPSDESSRIRGLARAQ